MSSKLLENMKKLAGIVSDDKSKKSLKKINEDFDVKLSRADATQDAPVSLPAPTDDVADLDMGDDEQMADNDEAEPICCPFCKEETQKEGFYDHMVDAHPEVMNINTQGQDGDVAKGGPDNVELSFEAKKVKTPAINNLPAKHAPKSGAGVHDDKAGKKMKRAKQKEEMRKEISQVEEGKDVRGGSFLSDTPKEWDKVKVPQNVNDTENKFVVPAKVKAELKAKVAELTKTAKELKHEDSKSAQQAEDLADVINDILTHLDKGTVDEFKRAQVLATSVWSGMMHQFPASFWDFITTGGWVSGDGKKAKDLKDYFNVVKAKEKV